MKRPSSGTRGPLMLLLSGGVVVLLTAGSTIVRTQAPAPRVDFARDVQPILKAHCVRCHGPEEQKNGFRLDRRSRAFEGVLRPNIIAGNSATSRVYQRVAGTSAGRQMPPDEPLAADQIGVLQKWIDEGAEWPDALANESDRAPADPAALRLIAAIETRDRAAVARLLEQAPSAVKGTAADGATPLMAAALIGDAALVSQLLSLGGEPNRTNYAGATALMWGLEDLETVKVLLRHGADPNVTSDAQRTILQIAAAQHGGAAVVQALLEAGAEAKLAPLTAAAGAGNVESVRLLLAAGAVDNGEATIAALRSNAMDCVQAIDAARPPRSMKNALGPLLPPLSPGRDATVRLAIERGADVNLPGPHGLTPLMRAIAGEGLTADTLKLLLARGADPLARSAAGETAVAAARRYHNAAASSLLDAPAVPSASSQPPLVFVAHNTIDAAVRRSLPLLQRTGVAFYDKSGCVSCHSNLLTALTVSHARAARLAVDEPLARQEALTLATDVRNTRDLALQGFVVPGGGPATTGYILIAMAAQGHAIDASTAALTRLLRRTQRSDGRWPITYRPPSESSEFTATAVAVRGLQLFGDQSQGARDRRAIDDGVAWLVSARPASTEDRVFRLFGLAWGQAGRATIRAAAADLTATQRGDGGWAQLPSLESDAYATGSALVALRESGLSVTDAAYRRGVAFLLKTQLADGSWRVARRAIATQVYFDSGFPHAEDQYISAAATNWATQALIAARGRPSS